MNIKTFIFLDCETTGLPSHDGNTTKITELCLTAVHSEHIRLGTTPRVQNKINLCFDPKKNLNPVSVDVSHLSNDLLQHQSEFNATTFNIIKDFVSLQSQPVCFVAHNGDGFDYPILRAELHNTGNELPDDILCVDSFKAFKEMYNEDTGKVGRKKANSNRKVGSLKRSLKETQNVQENTFGRDATNVEIANEQAVASQGLDMIDLDLDNSGCLKKLKFSLANDDANGQGNENKKIFIRQQFCFRQRRNPSFKLVKVYNLLTSKRPSNTHQAEADVNMLMACAVVLNDRFVNWAICNAKKFCDIPMMQPGRKIGT